MGIREYGWMSTAEFAELVRMCGGLADEADRLCDRYERMMAVCCGGEKVTYSYSGGLGTGVCHEWVKDKFNFFKWAVVSTGYLPGKSMFRYIGDVDFCPNNCGWFDNEIEYFSFRATAKWAKIQEQFFRRRAEVIGLTYEYYKYIYDVFLFSRRHHGFKRENYETVMFRVLRWRDEPRLCDGDERLSRLAELIRKMPYRRAVKFLLSKNLGGHLADGVSVRQLRAAVGFSWESQHTTYEMYIEYVVDMLKVGRSVEAIICLMPGEIGFYEKLIKGEDW